MSDGSKRFYNIYGASEKVLAGSSEKPVLLLRVCTWMRRAGPQYFLSPMPHCIKNLLRGNTEQTHDCLACCYVGEEMLESNPSQATASLSQEEHDPASKYPLLSSGWCISDHVKCRGDQMLRCVGALVSPWSMAQWIGAACL